MVDIISIRVTGLKEVQEMLNRFPENMRIEVGQKGVFKVAESLKRRTEYRYNTLGYGYGVSSGALLRSMQVRPTERGAIFEILAPYAWLLERGVREHWVSQEVIEYQLSNPGATMFKTAKDLGLVPPYRGLPVLWRWKGPFVAPALESLRPDISNILRPFIESAIKKSRRGR